MNDWITCQYFSEWSSRGYTSSTYVAGDFTASLEFFEDKLDDFNGNISEKNDDYHLTTNNCLQVTFKALSLGVLNDGTSVKQYLTRLDGEIIPNSAKVIFEADFYNNAFTLSEYQEQLNDKLDWYQSNWFTKWLFKSNINKIHSLLSTAD